MTLNPLNALKRKLNDDATPLSKRLCLAKNLVQSHHLPMAPKERVVAEWLENLSSSNKLSSEELHSVLDWLGAVDDLTAELKSKLIKIVSQYVHRNPLQSNDTQHILAFLENDKITSQLNQQIDDYLSITITLLQSLKNEQINKQMCQKLFNNLKKYYKDSKKKLEFIVKFLNGENLETVFDYLETECRSSVIEVCQTILFPISKKSVFISYLQTLIRKDNIEELVAEKGDNIQSVLKIMAIFFKFPEHRTEYDPNFLSNFIDVFVSCFRSESQIIFAFCIMVANVLNMEQTYITPTMNMPQITLINSDKTKRNLFLKMLEVISKNEVDITVRLTDTFGEKISKVEIKKNFLSFLQATMMMQLKLEGKPDKTTLQIIKTALLLDPLLIEQKINKILPTIMAMKKNNVNVMDSYKDMLNCLLEILFKLSHGITFLNQILPHVKTNLEACNTEQFELIRKLKELPENEDSQKLKGKIISGNDIFPQESVEVYGKLTMDLMFRQNKELFELLQKDFEEHCLLMLEEGFVSPSIITLAEVLSAILSSFLRHNKMADHTVPQHIAEEFWNMYQKFEDECLKKFGLCILKLSYNPPLLLSFLKLCVSFAQLKLLNVKYSKVKLVTRSQADDTSVFDVSSVLPCLSGEQWSKIASNVHDEEAVLTLNNLLLMKSLSSKVQTNNEGNNIESTTKSHLIKQLAVNPQLLTTNKYFTRLLFHNLDNAQNKQLAKQIVQIYLNNAQTELFDDIAISNNRELLNALVLESVRNITKSLDNCEDLKKALKSDFNMASFVKQVNIKDYFNGITISGNIDDIKKCIEILRHLQMPYLEENYQLTAIFVLLAVKRSCQTKKVRRQIDTLFQYIYELSPHNPDLYRLFPVDVMFSFDDTTMIDLLRLKIKTSNQLLIIKCMLELAVKRVKSESSLVKNIVELLLSKKITKKNASIDAFNDPAFQFSCIILPLLVKQKKALTASAFRSILADLQEKIQKMLLDSFKYTDFSKNINSTMVTGNTDDSVVDSDDNLAILNAMAAYSLTLSKYCETTDVEEIKNLDCLWSGFEFFIHNAIQTLQNPDMKTLHIESSIHLLNVTLRHIKKLESHNIFKEKDKLFTKIWQCIKERLLLVYKQGDTIQCTYLDDISVTLKFVCELSSVECFTNVLVADLNNLATLKKPLLIMKSGDNIDLIFHKVSKYLWTQCLKANIVGPKCSAMTKTIYQNSRNMRLWIRQHYETVDDVANTKKQGLYVYNKNEHGDVLKIYDVDDKICDILKVDLETLSEVILAGKKITIDYKFFDSIFELLHLVHYILGSNPSEVQCKVSWHAYFKLYEGCVAVLNSVLMAREEILEDRWPCYMQSYRALTRSLCYKATSQDQLERHIEEKLAEIAHSIEKLTYSITKKKKQVSRIAAYTVADICTSLEKYAPSRMVRIHLENSVSMFIQASDTSYAMAFLKRSLAGVAGQVTMTNMYNNYKRYHKYTGNS